MRGIPSQLLLVIGMFAVIAAVNLVPNAKLIGQLPIFQSDDQPSPGPEVPRTGPHSAYIYLMKTDRSEYEAAKLLPGAACAGCESRDSYNTIASQISSYELQRDGLPTHLN